MAPGYIEEVVRKRSASGNSNGSDKNIEEIEKTRTNWIIQHKKVTAGIDLIAGAFRTISANKVFLYFL